MTVPIVSLKSNYVGQIKFTKNKFKIEYMLTNYMIF